VLNRLSTGFSEARASFYPGFAAIPARFRHGGLPDEAEGWDFLQAVEPMPPPGFTLGALAVTRGDALLAAAPAFTVDYRIDTPLQGRLRQLGDWLYGHVPRAVSFPVIGIGSPMSDTCSIGFCPSLGPAERAQVFAMMLAELHREARARKDWLLSLKGLRTEIAEEFAPSLAEHGYMRVTSVPVVKLRLPFKTLEEYFASLPKKTAAYFRRKLRAAAELRIEYRTSLAGLEALVYKLFQSTLAQSKVDHGEFQQLDPAYFAKVVSELGDKAQLMLCWRGAELLSFQLFLIGADQVVAKQIGMKYPEARAYNLYFVNWIELIKRAIERRVPLVEMGATTYATKLLFGGYLERRWLYFRPRDDWAKPIFRRLSPMFDFESNDPELKALDARIP